MRNAAEGTFHGAQNGVVDEAVEHTKALFDPLLEVEDGVFIGLIEGFGIDAMALGGFFFGDDLELGGIARGDDEGSTSGGEGGSEATPEQTGSASEQDGLIFEGKVR